MVKYFQISKWWTWVGYSYENKPSPVANYLQNGFFVIMKDLEQVVLSWLSKMYLLAWEIFVKEILLDTAIGIAQITNFPLTLTT